MLDDGTSGMSAVKRSGGVCIVQEPVEAAYPDMPINVINTVDVDYRVSVADIGYIIDDIFSKQTPAEVPIPEDVKLEAQITERMVSSISELEKLGTHSNFTCPDCGGNLWLMQNDELPRYRCHTGHVYTEKVLIEKQTEELEESLWVSIRMLEERKNLLLTLAYREAQTGNNTNNTANTDRAEEISVHIERLKALLMSVNKNSIRPDEGYL
jgi:two-component system chemotaxis response regulator CheB